VLETGSRLRFQARGASMRPFIRDGDWLSAGCHAGQLPARANLIVSPDRGSNGVHRVLSVKTGALLIQGDALLQADGLVPFSDVLGR